MKQSRQWSIPPNSTAPATRSFAPVQACIRRQMLSSNAVFVANLNIPALRALKDTDEECERDVLALKATIAQTKDAVEKLFFGYDPASKDDQKCLPCAPRSLITRLIATFPSGVAQTQ